MKGEWPIGWTMPVTDLVSIFLIHHFAKLCDTDAGLINKCSLLGFINIVLECHCKSKALSSGKELLFSERLTSCNLFSLI